MSPQERADKVRELLGSETSGVLCTQSERMPGYPYGSIAPFVIDQDGSPVMFMSTLAVHTKNLQHDPKASLLVNQGGEGVAGGRVNLFGEVTPVTEEERIPALRELYLSKHPDAAQWIDFGDFSFYRMAIENIYWVGGFGAMGWVPVDAYQSRLNT